MTNGTTGKDAKKKLPGTALLTQVLTQVRSARMTMPVEINPESPIEDIVRRACVYNPNSDSDLLRRAYAYAEAQTKASPAAPGSRILRIQSRSQQS